MLVDLRSDTVTKPTKAMLDAMMHAEVGDDVFGEDPTVTKLEQKCAAMLGMEAGIYCPSGTMTNQIGIKILTEPYQEVICYQGAHIYKYEGGGLAGNSLVSARLLPGDRGRLSVKDVVENVNNRNDPHLPYTSVVALENTVVREAGSYYTLAQIRPISEESRKLGLKTHLDGARLFNAITATGDDPVDYGKHFDTISICLSKGLGAPVGSVLLCSKALEPKARRMRKVFGGGMRQAGYLAAAGIFALDHHILRLADDHKRASILGQEISKIAWVRSVMPVDTNIVIFQVRDGLQPEVVLSKLEQQNIRAIKFGAQEIRMVTHLDFNDLMLERTVEVIQKISL